MTRLLIEFKHDNVNMPKPWPVAVTDHIVTSGLGPDDGSFLVGFGTEGAYTVEVLYDDAVVHPHKVEGLVPVLVDHGQVMFNWDLPIKTMKVIEA